MYILRHFFQDAKYSLTKDKTCHCVKSVRIRGYSNPHFPPFEQNTGKCRAENLRIGTFLRNVFIESVLWNQ